ncbi:MAG: hypothetical protein GY730_07310 [bacterium]|nr:hypothetical protein [bacterium]
MHEINVLLIGFIIFGAFLFGELATKVRLPRVSGYLLAGVCFNPGIFSFIPPDFAKQTHVIIEISLAVITFVIGGSLSKKKMKKLGKSLVRIAFYQAEITFIVVTVGLFFILPFFSAYLSSEWTSFLLPLCILSGALAIPTDPAAVIAVIHEFKAKGDTSSAILGVAAIDDILTFINFAVAIELTKMTILYYPDHFLMAMGKTIVIVLISAVAGILFGFIFNLFASLVKNKGAGVLIVVTIGAISLCFGGCKLMGLDELLATMLMGMIVVNFGHLKENAFNILENYTEELIFVLFFTFSGMHLNFSSLMTATVPIILFTILRTTGKYSGTLIGAIFSNASTPIRKYVAWGLLPQGGIVLGLAMLIGQNPAFDFFSATLTSVIIGTTFIHELVGPIVATYALHRSGELNKA